MSNLIAAVELQSVARSFTTQSGGLYTAISNINLTVPTGSFVSIVGPSGCGKSTILNVAAGLIEPSQGTVDIFGQRLSGINRKATYMFQQDALLPWKTVLENVKLGLQFRDYPVEAAKTQALEWIDRVGLSGFADSYPYQLSGGMRKRVAMAQSWIIAPDIVLMDEPFGALDIHTRLRMETEILSLWQTSKVTVLFVTHDLEEAIALSDQVVVLSAGPSSTIVGSYPVDLPRPRNLIDIRTEPRFHHLYAAIWNDLRKEVLKSYDRQ